MCHNANGLRLSNENLDRKIIANRASCENSPSITSNLILSVSFLLGSAMFLLNSTVVTTRLNYALHYTTIKVLLQWTPFWNRKKWLYKIASILFSFTLIAHFSLPYSLPISGLVPLIPTTTTTCNQSSQAVTSFSFSSSI